MKYTHEYASYPKTSTNLTWRISDKVVQRSFLIQKFNQ